MPRDDATMSRALGRASTLDREARTVEAVALSGPAPAVRFGPAPDGSRGRWIEELDAAGADLSVFTGAPVLTDHENRVSASVGHVLAARIEGAQIVATVQFDGSAEADALMAKIEAGSVRGVSLGYSVQTWTKAGTRDGMPVFRATAWTPRELSFTPLPVDAGAHVRSQKGNDMTDQTTAPETTPAADDTNTTARTTAPAGWRSPKCPSVPPRYRTARACQGVSRMMTPPFRPAPWPMPWHTRSRRLM